jgi:hypothetical protein
MLARAAAFPWEHSRLELRYARGRCVRPHPSLDRLGLGRLETQPGSCRIDRTDTPGPTAAGL